MPEPRRANMTPARHARMNAAAWDEIAADRRRWFDQRGFDADFYRKGGSTLTPAETRALGDLHGLRVLHLQCASGEDTLSAANLGAAEVIGVDISRNQIEQARHKASEAGTRDVTFDVADVQKLPARYRTASFDRIYLTYGSIVWLDDLDGWADGIAAALSPGGRLVLSDEHPFQYVFEEIEGRLVLVHSYFERNPDYHTGWTHFPSERNDEQKVNFSWTLGDIITRLGQRDVVTVALEEYPQEHPEVANPRGIEWVRFPHMDDDPDKLPMSIVLIAEKRPC